MTHIFISRAVFTVTSSVFKAGMSLMANAFTASLSGLAIRRCKCQIAVSCSSN
jgi:hypothetical protein